MRAHNERLVLTLLRRHGQMAKSEIARATGLSAQTVSVIMRALESDGLLVKCAPVRGKIGQPSVPMKLASTGAYFFGLKIGRRSAELVLTDFLGTVIGRVHHTHEYPTPEDTRYFALASVSRLLEQLTPDERRRVAGLGIGMPFQLWDWARAINLTEDKMASWKNTDVAALIAAELPFPVYLQNDASAACGAELVFGDTEAVSDFLYFYIGFFIGGGLVLNGSVYSGRTGNAAALGSMPVPDGAGGTRQLIEVASLAVLDRMLRARALPSDSIWQPPDSWSVDEFVLLEWIGAAASAIACAIASAASVIDFDEARIDGWMPRAARAELVRQVRVELLQINLAGITPPRVREGSVGQDARALGAASLPLSERFLVDGQTLQSRKS